MELPIENEEELKEKPKKRRNFWPILILFGCITGLALTLSRFWFPVWAISVSGSEHLKPKEVINLTGITLGESWFWLSISKNIIKNPWIKHAVITKQFPGQILIEITERKPMAILLRDGKEEIIAEDGTVLPDAAKPSVIITGFGPKRLAESFEIIQLLNELSPSRIEYSPQGFLITTSAAPIWVDSIASLRSYANGVRMLARMGFDTNFSRINIYGWGVSLTP